MLSEKTRIEVYIPDRPERHYQNLVDAFGDEFTTAFGGATVIRGFEGRYEDDNGEKIVEKMNVVYADVPLAVNEFSKEIDEYLIAIKQAAHQVLEEESILVTARCIYHSE